MMVETVVDVMDNKYHFAHTAYTLPCGQALRFSLKYDNITVAYLWHRCNTSLQQCCDSTA
jgi:hypothetical protein